MLKERERERERERARVRRKRRNREKEFSAFFFFVFSFFWCLENLDEKNFVRLIETRTTLFLNTFSSLSTLIHSFFLQANCPMNIDGEHLSYEQVHEILNWRLFSSPALSLSCALSFSFHYYNNERLTVLFVVVIVVDAHFSLSVTFQLKHVTLSNRWRNLSFKTNLRMLIEKRIRWEDEAMSYFFLFRYLKSLMRKISERINFLLLSSLKASPMKTINLTKRSISFLFSFHLMTIVSPLPDNRTKQEIDSLSLSFMSSRGSLEQMLHSSI